MVRQWQWSPTGGFALLALLVLATGEEDSWTVSCNAGCGGVDTCADKQLCSGEMEELGICPDAPQCPDGDLDECIAQDCAWGEWRDWSNDGVSGVCKRSRAFTASKCGGLPCFGTIADTQYCEPLVHPPEDCELSIWSGWGTCDAATLQRWRTRSVNKQPAFGGSPCEGTMSETEPCGQRVIPVHCELGAWMQWSGCSRECDGGQQMRVRAITKEADAGGKLCKGEDGGPLVLQLTRPCNVDIPCMQGPAPQDCMLTEWSDWSHCDPEKPLEATQRYRSRSIAVPGKHGGATCDSSMQETEACEASDVLPPEDCQFTDWTPWKLCDKTCDGGQTFRTRSIKAEAKRGGHACEDTTLQTMPCNEVVCEIHETGGDCLMSQWTYWSECSTTCGQGIRKRSREVIVPPAEGGRGCSATLEEVSGCFDNAACDSQDCEWGSWTQWSLCTKSCDGGQRSRHRSVFMQPTGGGKQCEALDSTSELEPCNHAPCSTLACEDGNWHDWGKWGQCSRACGGGMRWRHRKIAKEADACGTPAVGMAFDEESCNEWECEVDRDCVMGDWTHWGPCSSSCYGQQSRSRKIEVQGSGDGKWCEGPAGEPAALEDLRPCNGPEESSGELAVECGFAAPNDCVVGGWSSWSMCSKTCGGGVHHRDRHLLRPSRLGGQPCNDTLQEVQECATETCGTVMDCQWDDWDEWGACNRCDGERVRVREIRHLGNELGHTCTASNSREVMQCNACKVVKEYYCVWADWEDSFCSVTCGTGGKLRRQRTLHKVEEMPAVADLVGTVEGNEGCEGREVDFTECKNIPVECTTCVPQNCTIGDWAEWTEPTNCDGICMRHRKIERLNNDCGESCHGSLRDTKSCIIPECNGTQECTFSQWSSWSGCLGENSQRVRVREVAQPTGPLGKACEGPQKETKPCEADLVQQDCVLSRWSLWSKCTKMCGGGQQDRERKVLHYAVNGGAPCNESLRMTRPCGTGVCETIADGEDIDCALGDWGEWEGCDKGLQATRTRSPTQEAKGGGLPCSGAVKESGDCPRSHTKDCVMSDWAPWGSCGATCGGGQRFRTREVLEEAQPGGVPCSGDTHETQTCSEEVSCNVQTDCVVSHWSFWSDCSVSCGQGQHVRQRKIVQAAQAHGAGCNVALLEVRGCEGAQTSQTCGDHVNCQWGSWAQWSECKQAEHCGLGYRSRARQIDVLPKGRGEPCDPLPTEEVKPDADCAKSCTKASTCIDGEWGNWGSWGPCSVTCGPGGTRSRSRTEKTKANHCGEPAPGDSTDWESCDAPNECESQFGKQDCEFGQWQQWQDCSATCNGARTRSRAIASYSAYGGAQCEGAVSESERCNPGADDKYPPYGCESGAPIDCVQLPLSDWSECSATCGTGFQSRKRIVETQPAYGGKACENPLEEIKECNATEPCVVLTRDCKLGDWQEWSSCDPFTAQTTRLRSVVAAQEGFGKACQGNMSETQPCERICKDKTYYCGWGSWQEWDPCSTTCGSKGRRKRSRSLTLTEATESGAPPAAKLTKLESISDAVGLQPKLEKLGERFEASSERNHLELLAAFSAGLAAVAAVFGFVKLLATQAPAAIAVWRHSGADRQPLASGESRTDVELQT